MAKCRIYLPIWSGDYRLVYTGISENSLKVGEVDIMLSKILRSMLRNVWNIVKESFQSWLKQNLRIFKMGTLLVKVYMSTYRSINRELEEIEKVIEQ